MLKRTAGIGGAVLASAAVVLIGGCCSTPCETKVAKAPCPCPEPAKLASSGDFPPNAAPGECYAKVFIPPKTETCTERVVVREASERLEVIPARYEWVEERVMVKDASTEIVEVPAETRMEEKKVLVECPSTEWVMGAKNCATPSGQPVQGAVWCLVNKPAVYKTVTTQCVCKPATTKCVTIPAEYQTVKRQKLASAATTKRICIPAEYDTVSKTVAVAPGHWEWQRVLCDIDTTAEKVNALKSSLLSAGYTPGPLDGEWGQQDWNALTTFQKDKGIAVGALSYESVAMLNAPR